MRCASSSAHPTCKRCRTWQVCPPHWAGSCPSGHPSHAHRSRFAASCHRPQHLRHVPRVVLSPRSDVGDRQMPTGAATGLVVWTGTWRTGANSASLRSPVRERFRSRTAVVGPAVRIGSGAPGTGSSVIDDLVALVLLLAGLGSVFGVMLRDPTPGQRSRRRWLVDGRRRDPDRIALLGGPLLLLVIALVDLMGEYGGLTLLGAVLLGAVLGALVRVEQIGRAHV